MEYCLFSSFMFSFPHYFQLTEGLVSNIVWIDLCRCIDFSLVLDILSSPKQPEGDCSLGTEILVRGMGSSVF